MKTLTLILALLVTAPAFVSCDRTVDEKTKTTTDSNGNTKVESKTTKETPNGDVITQQKKTTTENP